MNYFKAIFTYVFNDPNDPTKPSWDKREHEEKFLVEAGNLGAAKEYAQKFADAHELGLTFVNKRNTKVSLKEVVEPTGEELKLFLATGHILNRYEWALPS